MKRAPRRLIVVAEHFLQRAPAVVAAAAELERRLDHQIAVDVHYLRARDLALFELHLGRPASRGVMRALAEWSQSERLPILDRGRLVCEPTLGSLQGFEDVAIGFSELKEAAIAAASLLESRRGSARLARGTTPPSSIPPIG